ncbi:phosphotransferase [Streptomyces castrisilvae]|uniref:Phosphotransferase n=1 Tax=Streptomyces castrisilvae TaxID=3033811 RepID=A0ABY9HBT1_9ACTN|nr:phosphotransferase [Streptomyces sp. Mut1]WLQ31972.1 phosphotransferase [Streptomyces sp. Mut1]
MTRLVWDSLPDAIRRRVAGRIGSEIVHEAPAVGGFSPGMASVLTGADGRSAFVKAVSAEQNSYSPELYRREAALHAGLPQGLPAPTLMWSFDYEDWSVLAFAPVHGAVPPLPWKRAHLLAVLDTVRGLTAPDPDSPLPGVDELFREELTGWRSLAAAEAVAGTHRPTGTPGFVAEDPWLRRHLDRLIRLEESWEDAARGHGLLHADLRADNVLLTEAEDRPSAVTGSSEGSVVLVDWAYACRGATVFDLVYLLLGAVEAGGCRPEDVLSAGSGLLRKDEHDAAAVLLAAFTGWFTWLKTLPPVPGLPALRPFQARMAAAGRSCLTASGVIH